MPISILLPAYKGRFFEDALRSIFAQSYRAFELVIVDDRSPDDLRGILQSVCGGCLKPMLTDPTALEGNFEGISVRYYRNRENIGSKNLVSTRTHAMEFARYEWCVMACDDDVYHPDFLAEMVELVRRHPQVDLVHCCDGVIDANGNRSQTEKMVRPEFETGYEFAYNLFVRAFGQAIPDFMYRKSAYYAVGGFVDLPSAWGSDDATWVLLAFRNGIACSSRVLYWFRNSGINVTCRRDNLYSKALARILMCEMMLSFFKTLSPRVETERQMLSDTIKGFLENYTYDYIRNIANIMFLQDWFKVMTRLTIPLRWKGRILIDRIRKIM